MDLGGGRSDGPARTCDVRMHAWSRELFPVRPISTCSTNAYRTETSPLAGSVHATADTSDVVATNLQSAVAAPFTGGLHLGHVRARHAGCALTSAQRMNHFAAGPYCGVSWFIEGQAHLVDWPEGADKPGARPPLAAPPVPWTAAHANGQLESWPGLCADHRFSRRRLLGPCRPRHQLGDRSHRAGRRRAPRRLGVGMQRHVG